MNRIAMMVLKNTFALPGLWSKLCAHAKNPDNYPEIERLQHIQKIMKAAIKAGWRNDEKELLALVEQVMAREELKYCPHGRPICVTLSKKQLEKQFKRA